MATIAPDVVFANESEAQMFGDAACRLALDPQARRAWLRFGDEERPALPVDRVVDTTGAGDALAAGWIVGGPDLALEAAARCVQTLGALLMP